MTDSDIRALDDATVEQIAAGEVVERPASAVKELVENSLDAGASRVDVTVAGDGTDRLAVADDGHGMSETDVRRAVERHTTSKIRDASDLDSGVSTLGFRGEALSTIGAVSRMTVTTRPPGADTGTRLEMVGGEVTAVEPAGRAPGTTVEVRDLFYNTPARRKFLKAERTEFGHVNRVVTRYALAEPDVAVSLTHDGRETFATEGQGDRLGAVMAVFGREVAESMREVAAAPDTPAVERVYGHVSDPETTRSTREYLATYVNGRAVSESALREAVLDGYGDQLAADRFPFAVLFVEVPADAVDVNVHPRKTQVRFDDETAVRRAVREAVRDALLEGGLVRSGAPRGRSAPDDAPVAPGDGADDDPDAAPTSDESEAGGDGPTAGPGDRGPTTDDRRPAGAAASSARRASADGQRDAGSRADAGGGGPRERASDRGTTGDRGADDADWPGPRPAGPTENATLPGTGAPDPDGDRFDRLPALQVLGQLDDTYLVAAADDGLVLVDQHAADERVHYERLRAALGGETAAQALVSPVTLELTAAEAAVFDDALDDLRAWGFDASLDGREATVRAVPAVLADSLDPALLRDVLAASLADAESADAPLDSAADALLADMACAPAITGNTSLAEGSAVALLDALDGCENPFACPHGRPVLVEIDADELADRFERDYPGHQFRRPEG